MTRSKKSYVLKIEPGLYLGSSFPFAEHPKMRSFVCWTGAQQYAERFTAIMAGRVLQALKDYESGQHAKIVKIVPKRAA